MTENLIQGLLKEIDRVTTIRGQFEELRGMPHVIVEPQIALMTAVLKEAKDAIGIGDTIKMLSCYATLKEYEE